MSSAAASVALVGRGPATEAVAAALADVDATIDRHESVPDRPAFDGQTLAVVVGESGTDAFEDADRAARAAGTAWLALELGGVGGHPLVEASVAGFDPDRECYDCLETRVAACADGDADAAGAAAPDAPTARLAGALAGRTAADHLEGDDSMLGRVVELPHAERRFLPVPGCRCADEGRDFRPRRGHDAVDLEDALARAEQALDERVGVATQVGEVDSYPAPYYLAQLCDASGFSDAAPSRQAAGVATDWNAAFMKALGEAYERYAAGVYRERETVTAAPSAVPNAVDPGSFVAPGDGFAGDESLEWVPARNLATGADVRVPADLVFHPPRNRSIRPAVTTGLGLGTSADGALRSGLTEVVERDAAMIAWYSTYEPLGLTVDDPEFEALAARARTAGLTVTPALVTQDVDVPVVAVAVQRDEWPRFAIGSAADLDPVAAARGALEEAVQNWLELRNLGPEAAVEANGAIGRYAEDPGPAAEFVDVGGAVPAESVGPENVPAGAEQVDALVERVVDADLTPYATRTTTRDLDGVGLETGRVLVPAAQPLFFGDSYFGERARRVPDELGFEPRPDRDHHPFP